MKTNVGLKFKGTISPIAPRIRRSPRGGTEGVRANLPRRQFLHLAAGAAALPATSAATFGQTYPTRPIRLVVPFPPGGINDAIGRPWADSIGSLLGPVVVENIGGGGSRTGVSSVAKAQPDGYTILVGNTGNFVIAPIASSRLPYDPLVDFDPIYRLAIAGLTFVVHPSLPVTTLGGLVEYSKRNPGKLSYASAGTGTVNHLLGEMFKLQTMTRDIVHVPYRGAGPALNDLVGGQVPIMVAAVSGQLFELDHAGKVRILAVTTPNRLPGAPEIPTVAEAGYPALTWESFIGLFAPKGTPKPIIEKIAQASRSAIEGSELQRLWTLAGMQPDNDSSPEKMRSFLEQELSRLRPIVSALGFTVD